MLKIVDYYRSQGFNVNPVPSATKEPIIKWKEFQERKATESEVATWFPNNYKENIAVVLGKTSENLCDIDCDSLQLLEILSKALSDTMIVKSYRGGHIYLRADYEIRKFTLDLGKYGKLEVLGQGQIGILPPSIHQKGIIYEFISQKPVKHWSGDFRHELIEWLEKLLGVKIKREPINIQRILEGVPEGERDASAIQLATWYRKQGLSKIDVLERLFEWNKLNKPPLLDNIITIKVESAFRP